MSYFQHTKCSRQKHHILDQCYTNVQDTYTSVSLPPLRQSDHNLVQLIPKYRPLVQREQTVSHTFKEWSTDAVQNLNLDCISCPTVHNTSVLRTIYLLHAFKNLCQIGNMICTKQMVIAPFHNLLSVQLYP